MSFGNAATMMVIYLCVIQYLAPLRAAPLQMPGDTLQGTSTALDPQSPRKYCGLALYPATAAVLAPATYLGPRLSSGTNARI